jgi:hypothetical protein
MGMRLHNIARASEREARNTRVRHNRDVEVKTRLTIGGWRRFIPGLDGGFVPAKGKKEAPK